IKELALEAGASQGRGSVIIQSVYVGGNAEKAGLRVGDRIVRFNGR
ncbi:MAG: PDZ domain-containing protein, partial [candidate division Zixibacteria bacterium]|nr:PDZ domain-containing protein [Phycisphaerae bacterium]NIT53267.1 PDZ domain-containing protein [candidate division Zixibacteria bacterium]NIU12410.1 PDZ domain-containing protein [Phycisphaerae bacterium]NIW95747.1 PDZ domain-containing protein [Phycisphaerae bacterium]NIX00911.1 PDZ domain-containing protein [Phycisphaerae bacterium]